LRFVGLPALNGGQGKQGIGMAQNGCRGVSYFMAEEVFEPIKLNAKAPGGERVLRSFDDIRAFILMRVEIRFRELPWWQAVRKELPQTRFGARQKETHAAMRAALWEERWLDDPTSDADADALAEIELALRKASDDGRL
jgi:hypothetical protein